MLKERRSKVRIHLLNRTQRRGCLDRKKVHIAENLA